MIEKRISIALCKSDFHKAMVHEDEEGMTYIDNIYNFDLYEYPIEEMGKLNLYDLDSKEKISQFERIEDVSLSDFPIEELCYYGIYPNSLTSIKIPLATTSLLIQASDGLTFTWYNDNLVNEFWNKLRYESMAARFISEQTEDEIDVSDSKFTELYNIDLPKLNLASQIDKLILKIEQSNICILKISHIYLSNKDLMSLSTLRKLIELRIFYSYNDNFLWLPPNLKHLKIFGTTIKKLSQINFKKINLIDLSLEGNCINDLSEINILPRSLTYINLEENRITTLPIRDLPPKIETLCLGRNFISNSFFEGLNGNVINKTIKNLSLSYNHLKINNWLLKRILYTFPNLENLELEGNIIAGIDNTIFINDDEASCVERIKSYMSIDEYKIGCKYESYESKLNFYEKNHNVTLKWRHETLPVDEIILTINYLFKEYLSEMNEELICFDDGLYCNFCHDKTSMLISGLTGKENSIAFSLFAFDSVTLGKYFYKYFIEINRIVGYNIHHYILPMLEFPEKSKEFELFYKKVFDINDKIGNAPICYLVEGIPNLLVRKITKKKLDELQRKTEDFEIIRREHYKEIRNIAFVIDAEPYLYPYFIDEFFLISNIEENRKDYKKEEYYKVRAESQERKKYSKYLKNKYLGESVFQEGVLYLGSGNTVGPIMCFNTQYFKKEGNSIICLEKDIKINYECLENYKKEGKVLELRIIDNKIEGSYV